MAFRTWKRSVGITFFSGKNAGYKFALFKIIIVKYLI